MHIPSQNTKKQAPFFPPGVVKIQQNQICCTILGHLVIKSVVFLQHLGECVTIVTISWDKMYQIAAAEPPAAQSLSY